MFQLRATRYTAGDLIEVEGVPVRLKVDRRARRVSLRVDQARREVVATAPTDRRLAEAAAFAKSRADWMADRLAQLPAVEGLAPGGMIEVLGEPCRLELAPGRRSPGLMRDELGLRLVAAGEGAAFGRAVVRVLRTHALKVLAERTEFHVRALGVALAEVKITDARSRWGSCKPPRGLSRGVIRYSWRLILSPWEVMDYVAAHECAHLVRADHSPAFWAVVATLTPHAKRSRAWLRKHGPGLHAVG